MYVLIGAKHRQNRRNGRWQDVDLTNVPVHNLAVTHGDVWLFITYPSLTEPKALRFDKVASWVFDVDTQTTVQEWLTQLGTTSLPFAETFPGFTPTYVNYVNAWHAGYDIQPIKRGGYYNPVGSRYDKEDLIVRRADLDPAYLAKRAMFTVNGFFHMTDYNPQGTYIRDGNKTLVRSNDNQIGVYSFANLGELQYIPITAEMVAPQGPESPLKHGLYLTLPDGIALEEKTPLLVLGGYLHTLSKEFFQVGQRTFKVDPMNLQLLERYYDSYPHIDLTSLGLPAYEGNPGLVEVEQLLSDEALLAYVTLEQSFLVLLDQPGLFQEFVPLEYAGFPGRYLDPVHQTMPLVGAYGRMLEHHRIYEDGVSLIAAERTVRYNYDFQRLPWQSQAGVDGGSYPSTPFRDAVASIRYLGVEK